MWRYSLLALLCSACTTTSSVNKNQAEVSREKVAKASASGTKKAQCYPLNLPLGKDLPVYTAYGDGGFVVVRVEKPCLTEDGIKGAEKQSPWMAMGIPCAGTSGTTKIRGHSYNPKMISFVLSISCPMVPRDLENIEAIARENIGIQMDAPLVAYNPLSVQYWEIDGLSDVGIGPEVELRSTNAVDHFWKEFSKGEQSLKVALYGRESAWVSDHNFYEAKVELSYKSVYEFNAKLLSVRNLNATEFDEVKTRCKRHPQRFDCDRVLGSEL